MHEYDVTCLNERVLVFIIVVVSHGTVRTAASSYAAMRMVAGSRPVLVIVW